MDFNRQNIFQATAAKKDVIWDEGLRSYMLKVYNYMATGVLLTGIIALGCKVFLNSKKLFFSITI